MAAAELHAPSTSADAAAVLSDLGAGIEASTATGGNKVLEGTRGRLQPRAVSGTTVVPLGSLPAAAAVARLLQREEEEESGGEDEDNSGRRLASDARARRRRQRVSR